MGESTGLPETSAMKTGKSGDIMIDCPYCDFARPVAACLSTCEPNIVNWCPKIKTVPIEHLDLVAPKALRGKPHLEGAWKERRDFFLTPVAEPRASWEDDYDPDVHGGGGVVTADELGVSEPEQDNMQDSTETDDDIELGPHAGEVYDDGDVPPDDNPEEEDPEKDEPDPEEETEDKPEPEPDPDEPPEAKTETQQEESDVTASDDDFDALDYPCPVKDCEGGGNSLKGLKIHMGRKHRDWEGQLPEEPKKPGKKAAKATSKKTSKKSKRSKKFQDTGRLIIVAGDKCHIIEDANEDFSEDLGAIMNESEEEVSIYKLGPLVRVRTVIEEV